MALGANRLVSGKWGCEFKAKTFIKGTNVFINYLMYLLIYKIKPKKQNTLYMFHSFFYDIYIYTFYIWHINIETFILIYIYISYIFNSFYVNYTYTENKYCIGKILVQRSNLYHGKLTHLQKLFCQGGPMLSFPKYIWKVSLILSDTIQYLGISLYV